MIDLTLRCPTCDRRADMCFDHGDEWKKRDRYEDTRTLALQRMTEHELRAAVHEFTEDDPPPYGKRLSWTCPNCALDHDEPWCWSCGRNLMPQPTDRREESYMRMMRVGIEPSYFEDKGEGGEDA